MTHLDWTAVSYPGVDVARTPDRVYMRSADRQGPMLEFSRPEWKAFLDGVKNGEFDLIE